LWSRQFGGTGDDVGRAIAIDADDNLIIVGQFRDSFTIGNTTLTSAGGRDIFVAKLAAGSGEIAWAKRFGGTGDDEQPTVVVDASNNIYVAGTFRGPVDFGGGVIQGAGNSDGFAMKLDSGGTHVWSKQIGGAGFDLARGIATQGTSVFVVGSFQQSMTVNATTVTSVGGDDAFVVQFAADGGSGWVKGFGGTGGDIAAAVTVDGAGNVVVAGRFSGTTNFGGGSVMSAGFDDAFIAKYAGGTGAYLFHKRFGGSSFDFANAVATDSSSIFVTGIFTGSVDFGGPAPLNGGTNNMYIAKFSLAGGYQWAKGFGDSATVLPHAMSVNASGDVSVAGDFCGSFTLGGPTMTSVKSCAENDHDIFAARLAGSDGSHLNSTRAGGTALDAAWGVTQSPDGRYFVVGGFQGFSEFGGQGLTSAGGYDVVVLGLAPL